MSRKLPFREFEWTPELAYVVGLLVTDGNLSKNGKNITMRSSDVQLLKTFKNCLATKAKIAQSHNDGYAVKPSYRVQFSNVQLHRWLVSIGVTPAKTYTIGEVLVPDTYFRDFLRGHLDGDGTILFYNDRYNTYRGITYSNLRLYTKFISASERHIRWLYKKIIALAGIRAALIKNTPQDKSRVPMWVVKIAKKASLKLLPWIYYRHNLPALERKRNIAFKALDIIGQEKRRPYTRIIIT